VKAIRMHALGGPDVLHLDEVPDPVPGAGEVLIKVAACGVNYGDLMQRQGAYGAPEHLPAVMGLEVAGTVEAAGPGTDPAWVGRRVAALTSGGYAQYATAPAAGLFPLPETVSMEQGAAFPVSGITAHQVLMHAGRLAKGETVLVHAAAGAVGGLAVQIARELGAGLVIGAAGTAEKREQVTALGGVPVDYTRDDWAEQVLEASGGHGVDVVLDSVGDPITGQNVAVLAPFARIVAFGAAGGRAAQIPVMALIPGNASLVGYSLMGRGAQMQESGEAVLALADEGRIALGANHVLPLHRAAEAHAAIAARATIGKTVLTP
jgi:NADPH:quinone reductase